MLLISHRGNIHGRKPDSENNPEYIRIALRSGFYVETDLFASNNQLYLSHTAAETGWGHYLKDHLVDERFLQNDKLLVHCKTPESLIIARQIGCHYFYHSNDEFTVTSKGWPIAHSSQGAKKKTICMLPEINGLSKESVEGCFGVCSDMISFYE